MTAQQPTPTISRVELYMLINNMGKFGFYINSHTAFDMCIGNLKPADNPVLYVCNSPKGEISPYNLAAACKQLSDRNHMYAYVHKTEAGVKVLAEEMINVKPCLVVEL